MSLNGVVNLRPSPRPRRRKKDGDMTPRVDLHTYLRRLREEENEREHIENLKPQKTPFKDRLYFMSLKALYWLLLPAMIIKALLGNIFKK